MKYVVTLDGGLRYEITPGTDGVRVEAKGGAAGSTAETAHALLSEVAGSPLYHLTVEDAVYSIRARRGPRRGSYTIWLDGHRYQVEALDERTRAIRDLEVARESSFGPSPLTAPMPGLVIRVLALEGEVVQPGQGLIVIEAMKMENELRAATSGRVKRVHAVAGAAVEKGALLVELEHVNA